MPFYSFKVARDSPMSEERAFELLFLHTSLQMFDSTDEAADVIQVCHFFYFLFLFNHVNLYSMSQNIVSYLCGCCGGAVSFIPFISELHRIDLV